MGVAQGSCGGWGNKEGGAQAPESSPPPPRTTVISIGSGFRILHLSVEWLLRKAGSLESASPARRPPRPTGAGPQPRLYRSSDSGLHFAPLALLIPLRVFLRIIFLVHFMSLFLLSSILFGFEPGRAG